MQQFLNVQQRAFLFQQLNDHVVGFKYVDPIQRRIGAWQIAAIRADRIGGFDAIFLADDIVIRAVARRRVYRTGTGFQRHVIAQHHQRLNRQERMLEFLQLQRRAFAFAQHTPFADARALHHAFDQIFRQDQRTTIDLQQLIVKFRV